MKASPCRCPLERRGLEAFPAGLQPESEHLDAICVADGFSSRCSALNPQPENGVGDVMLLFPAALKGCWEMKSVTLSHRHFFSFLSGFYQRRP